jgi:hypothetical protein
VLAGFPDIDGGVTNVRAALTNIAQRYLEVVMTSDVIALWRLIIAEGPRFPELVQDVYHVGQDRVTGRLVKALRAWATRELIRPVDPDRIATQFFAAVRGDLHMRALSGLLPDDLDKAMRRNVQGAVGTFWPALRPGGSHET